MVERDLEGDLRGDLTIGSDINDELRRQPGLIAHYTRLAKEIRERLRLLRLKIGVFEATLDEQIRSMMRARGQKPTEVQIDRRMMQNDAYISLKQEEITLEGQLERLEGVVKSMEAKGFSLTQISANMRAEMENLNKNFRFSNGLPPHVNLPTQGSNR